MELFLSFSFARADAQVSWQIFQLAFCCCDTRGHVSPRKCMLNKKEESARKGLIFCKISFAEFTRCRKLLILHALVPWNCKQSFSMPFYSTIYPPPSSLDFFTFFPPFISFLGFVSWIYSHSRDCLINFTLFSKEKNPVLWAKDFTTFSHSPGFKMPHWGSIVDWHGKARLITKLII